MRANPLRKLCWLGVLLAGFACGEDRLRSESRAFLSLYEVIDHRQPAQIRELKLAALGSLVLTEPDVKKARDECVAAHRALLSAEREHEQAATQLDRAIAQNDNGGPLPAATTELIRQGIDHAEQSLTKARGLFERCENQARSLSLRFGKT
jgi:hypothetical protein